MHPPADCPYPDMCFSWATVAGLVKYRSLWRKGSLACIDTGECASPFDINDGLVTSLVVQFLSRAQLYVYASRAHDAVKRQHILLSRLSSFRRIVADAREMVGGPWFVSVPTPLSPPPSASTPHVACTCHVVMCCGALPSFSSSSYT